VLPQLIEYLANNRSAPLWMAQGARWGRGCREILLLFSSCGRPSLRDESLHGDALKFYLKSKHLSEEIDGTLLVQMGRCFLHVQDDQQAEECFREAVELDGEDIDPRIELARMYERLGKPEQAFHHLNEVMLLRRRQGGRSRSSDEGRSNIETVPPTIKKTTRRRYRPRQQTQRHLLCKARRQNISKASTLLCGTTVNQ
jgi:general transcription factor 3C polypeptide 3 (transcription factor C subunit 4)